MRARCTLLAVGCWLALVGSVRADTITLRGSSIPMRDCVIEAIQGGRAVYRDAAGQRWERPLDDIGALGFDGLESLDRAEALIAERSHADAVDWLLKAMLESGRDVERLWVHVRLAQVHDLRGEFVQAAGHAARVFVLNDDPVWVRLEPVSAPNEPSYAAALEAERALADAARTVRSTGLVQVVQRLAGEVQPIARRLAATYEGPAIEPGSTISGVDRTVIMRPGRDTVLRVPEAAPEAPRPAAPPAPSAPVPDRARPEPPARAPAPTPVRARPRVADPRDSPETIAALLDGERYDEALAACRRVEAAMDDRGLAAYLHQYGRALRESGRPDDAAVMFMRCALLYRGTPEAEESLLETAIIYREVFDNSETATRLLQRAEADARRYDHPDLAAEAAELLRAGDPGARR